jgi:hypothetical protein
MRPRALLILFLVVAGLGAFVWFYERELPGSDERAERSKRLLPGLDADEISALELTTENGTVMLARTPLPAEREGGEDGTATGGPQGEWRITSPLEARADDAAVAALLSTLETLERKRTLEDLDAAGAGLTEPSARLVVRSDDEETVLTIGSSVPASGDVLVAVGEAAPYFVTGGRIVEQIDKAPGEWRDRDLFPWSRADIDHLRIETPTGELLLGRRGEDFWVEEPYADRADAGAVSRLLTALTGLRAETFLDEPVAESGLDEPELRLEVVLADREEPVRVQVGGRIDAEPPRRYAVFGTQTVEIADDLAGAVAGDPERWRSPDWASLEVFEIDRVELERGDETLVLERADGEWTRDAEPIPFGVASDLLYAVTGAQAASVEEGSLLGEATMRIVLESEERAQTLQLFAPREGRHPATADDRPVVLWLDEETVTEIEERWTAVREAEDDGGEGEVDEEGATNSPS